MPILAPNLRLFHELNDSRLTVGSANTSIDNHQLASIDSYCLLSQISNTPLGSSG